MALILSCPSMPPPRRRLLIGLGAVPAALTIYLRARLPETPRYTMQASGSKHLHWTLSQEETAANAGLLGSLLQFMRWLSADGYDVLNAATHV